MKEKKSKRIQISEQQVRESFVNEQAKQNALERAQASMQATIKEIVAAQDSLKEIKNCKQDDKILVFLGAGMLAEASIKNTSKVTSSIGGNVFSETTIEKAIQELENKRAEAEKNQGLLQQEMGKTQANLEALSMLIIEAEKIRQERMQAKK